MAKKKRKVRRNVGGVVTRALRRLSPAFKTAKKVRVKKNKNTGALTFTPVMK